MINVIDALGITNKKIFVRKLLAGVMSILLILCVAAVFASTPPLNFSGQIIITIQDGETLSTFSQRLTDAGIIRSQFLFKALVVILGDSNRILKGDYLFDKPQSVIRIAYRVVNGVYGLPKIKVTIPEGSNSRNIAIILKKAIPSFDGLGFLSLAISNEGSLFPDTYFFYDNITPDGVIKVMHDNFDTHFATVADRVSAFGKSQTEVLKMASIVEKEATTSVDRQIIAGILWKRLDDNMALQVDPPFFYYLNKTSEQLTLDDLATDSPYNLYKHIGLPPTPIDNPGLDAIIDTITPTVTKYWYYLSDKDGGMHYATTYDGHLLNKEKYLQ